MQNYVNLIIVNNEGLANIEKLADILKEISDIPENSKNLTVVFLKGKKLRGFSAVS